MSLLSRLKGVRAYHPYLLGIFPVAFLYSRNVTEMRFGEMFAPAGLIVVVVVLAMFVLKPLVRDHFKRGLALSSFLILFFAFGHFVELVADATFFLGAKILTAETVVAGVLLALLIILGILILRCRRDLTRVTRLLNQIALSLLVIQIAMAGYAYSARGEAVEADEAPPPLLTAEIRPDIYYIILDGYARSDVLKDIYDYDNAGFLQALTERGFYIADSSLANYISTAQSLTSSLNLDYMHRVVATDRGDFSRMPTAVMLQNNRLTIHLRKFGYSTVAFSTGYAPTEINDADYYFSPGWTLSEFQNHLLNSTPLPLLSGLFKSQFDLHRERLSYILHKLSNLADVPSPKFVFADVSCPHPPFVFGEHGEPVQRDWPFSFSDGDHYLDGRGTLDEYLTGYRNQVAYVSGRILEAIDSISANSTEPPVIILQADHGPGSRLHWESLSDTDLKERFAILNAYSGPGLDSTVLYKTISPVNSFRVVLNRYFGTQYEMLPDRCYFTTWTRPYNYLDVTENLRWHYQD